MTSSAPRQIRTTVPLVLQLVAATGVLLVAGGCQSMQQREPKLTRWDRARVGATLQVADEHMAAGKFDNARRTLEAIAQVPDPRVTLAKARVEIEEGHYESALSTLDEVPAEALPVDGYDHLRAIAYEGLGQNTQAAAAYEAAYRRRPSVESLCGWIDALVLADRAQEAAEVLNRERRAYAGDAAVHVLAARLCEQIGDVDGALSEWDTAALAERGSRVVRRRLADACKAAGQYARAADLWRDLIADCADTDERRELRHRLAGCQVSARRYEDARQNYNIIALTHPDDRAAQLGLSATCLACGKPAEALAAAQRVLERDPNQRDARLLAALSHARLDQTARAAELLAGIAAGDGDARVGELLARWR